jgi:hypothetical protein
MITGGVLVVGETPRLGRSIVDLLRSENVPCGFAYDVSAHHPLESLSQRYPVVVAACSEEFCGTARRWARGEFPGVTLVVVGSQDPALSEMAGIRFLPVPLVPTPLVSLLRSILPAGAGGPNSILPAPLVSPIGITGVGVR